MRILTTLLVLLSSLFVSPVCALAKPVPVEYYSRLPAIFDASISPDGKWLATVIDNKGRYILRVFNLENPSDKTLRAAPYPKDVLVNWVKWANNDQLLISTRQKAKINNIVTYTSFLYVTDRDFKKIRLVLKPELQGGKLGARLGGSGVFRQINDTVVDFLPDDPEHILMSYGALDPNKPGVHKVNLKTLKAKKVRQGGSYYQNWYTDLRHELRLGEGRKDLNGEWNMTIREANTKKWHNVKDYPGLTAETPVFGFTENPDELVIGAYGSKDTLGLFVYDLGQKRITRKLYQNDRYDVSGIIYSPDGKKLVGATYVSDTTQRVFFDPAYKARIEKIEKALPDYQIHLIEETPDGRIAVFKAEGPSNPPVLMIMDFETGKTSGFASDYPELQNIPQGDVIKVRYTARDGVKIPAYVTTPPAIVDGKVALKNLPFIIMPHGGPYGRDTASFDYLAQLMASRGYVVLQMNFRGSEGLGKSFRESGRKNWVIMQEDVEDGTRWLIRKGYADPKRICIVGWSYGGYAALMGAIKNPDLYACAASIAGVTDLQDMVNDIKKYRFGRHTAKNFLLQGFSSKDDMKANSPVKRAKDIHIPVFLAHGKKDVNVHYDQFKRMIGALKRAHVKYTALKFDEEDHYFINYENRTRLLKGLDKFLRANLGDSPAAP